MKKIINILIVITFLLTVLSSIAIYKVYDFTQNPFSFLGDTKRVI